MTDRIPIGIDRLDELLKGGLAPRSITLVYGPPFIGKRLLGRIFLLAGMRHRIPGVLVHTDHAAQELRSELGKIDGDYAKYEKQGLSWFVDTYSKAIGATDHLPNVELVDGLMNFNSLNLALNNVQRSVIRNHSEHRLLFDSVSTLIAYTNVQAAFRYLQVLTGKAKAAGATVLLVMEEGMHSEAEVQTIKHLSNGIIELRKEKDKTLMAVEGLGLTTRVGWVEYDRTPKEFVITGSFAAGRIR